MEPRPIHQTRTRHSSAWLEGQRPPGSIGEIIHALEQDFPGLRFNLCYETGELRPNVNIFLNSANIRYLQGLDMLVSAGTSMHVLQSVAGG